MESQDSLRVALAAIEQELQMVEQRALDLRKAADALRQIGAMNGASASQGPVNGADDEDDDSRYPRTTDAVASVLRSREAHAYTTRQVLEEAQRRRLLNPHLKKPYGTVLEALKRLVEKEHDRGFLRVEPATGDTRWVYLPSDSRPVYYMYTGDPENPSGDPRPLTR